MKRQLYSLAGCHQGDEGLLRLQVDGEHRFVGDVGQRQLVLAVLGLHGIHADQADERLQGYTHYTLVHDKCIVHSVIIKITAVVCVILPVG